MSKPACPRLFEVEAMRDGRLAGMERASFERHMKGCATCAREAEALETIARAAREDVVQDELRVRRARTRLLAAFDGSLVHEERRPTRWLLPAASLVLAAGAVVVWRVAGDDPAPAPPSPSPPSLHATVIEADGAALYSRKLDGRRERVVLERGTLRIAVEHTDGRDDAHLLVTLPDGELEDTGTTFTVTAADGRTTHVAVEEGSVVLRLHERPPIELRAGESWSASIPAPSPPPVAATAPPRPQSPPPADASKDFRDAMAAMNAGDHRGAAARFAQFLEAHPRDARAEDAAYLRVLALHRAGAEEERKEAARLYLERHPSGFRRAEVERLAE